MGDRIIQLNLNYETIQKHAGLSPYKYFLKPIKHETSLVANEHFGSLLETCRKLNDNVTEHNTRTSTHDPLKPFISNLNLVNEYIKESNLSLIQKSDDLNITKAKHISLTNQLDDITNYRDNLFPEFVSRVYKTPVAQILTKWQELLDITETSNGLPIQNAISLLKQNPKIEMSKTCR